jgi:Ca2+-binding RTX toxin-like protein
VVTPHAAFLALRWAPGETLSNLERLRRDFPGMYGKWGFRDSVNVDSGVVSDHYLSLDQGMIMAAIGNALERDMLRDVLPAKPLRPVVGMEEFGASPRPCTITGSARSDRLRGTSGDDVICAGDGHDRIEARGGDDAVFGDGGDDRIDGDSGDDTLYGGGGRDRLRGGSGWDVSTQ